MDLYKICAGCGAVSPAEDMRCPVCGALLADVPAYSLAPKASEFRVEKAESKERT